MNEERETPSTAQPVSQQRNPTLELLLLAILVTIVAGVSVGVAWKIRSIKASKPRVTPVEALPSLDDLPVMVPDFSLIDKDGHAVTLADLKGQVWVANFFFASCPAQCPAMNLRMAQIQKALPDGAAAKLVSITVDPERDSPEVLKEYAKTYGAKDDRWLFLTGDKQAIIRLAVEGFKLSAGDDPNLHSTRLVLVDRQGRVRGYFKSTDEQSVEELQGKLNQMLKEE